MTWEETKDPEYPYCAKVNQDNYLIRLNDFPEESLYTLIVNNEEIEDLEDWPDQWIISSNVDGQKLKQRVRRVVRPTRAQITPTESAALVRRIIAGDALAEEEIFLRFKDSISVIIRHIVRGDSAAEDGTQDTFRIALEKIRQGDVPDPKRLSGFIRRIARQVAFQLILKPARRAEPARRPDRKESAEAERIVDATPNQFDQLLQQERAEILHQVISEFRVKRDRDVLMRYYIGEEDKEQICADLGLARKDFNKVIFRARKRLKELVSRRS